MCSTPDPRPAPDSRLALIGIAIDKLAEEARAGGPGDGADGMAARLACLWAMMADLDPALAQRLPRYTATD
jgi:hypothetical protein